MAMLIKIHVGDANKTDAFSTARDGGVKNSST